jgi:hypothetical protein
MLRNLAHGAFRLVERMSRAPGHPAQPRQSVGGHPCEWLLLESWAIDSEASNWLNTDQPMITLQKHQELRNGRRTETLKSLTAVS